MSLFKDIKINRTVWSLSLGLMISGLSHQSLAVESEGPMLPTDAYECQILHNSALIKKINLGNPEISLLKAEWKTPENKREANSFKVKDASGDLNFYLELSLEQNLIYAELQEAELGLSSTGVAVIGTAFGTRLNDFGITVLCNPKTHILSSAFSITVNNISPNGLKGGYEDAVLNTPQELTPEAKLGCTEEVRAMIRDLVRSKYNQKSMNDNPFRKFDKSMQFDSKVD